MKRLLVDYIEFNKSARLKVPAGDPKSQQILPCHVELTKLRADRDLSCLTFFSDDCNLRRHELLDDPRSCR
jgi:hypothetical protein